jgi:hypothetical protein
MRCAASISRPASAGMRQTFTRARSARVDLAPVQPVIASISIGINTLYPSGSILHGFLDGLLELSNF